MQWEGDPLDDDDWLKYRVTAFLNDAINEGRQRLWEQSNQPPDDEEFAT